MHRLLLASSVIVVAFAAPARSDSDDAVRIVDCAVESATRSLNANTPTSIVFVNGGADLRDIYWLNYDAKRVLYGRLQPGTNLTIDTFVTHPWVVADTPPHGSGRCLAIYLPAAGPHTINIP